MRALPFQQSGRFYRGNLHTHSTRSDGGLSPAEVIASYRERGYDFLSLTDHFLASYGFPIVDTREFRTAQFTTLIGAELHAPQTHLGDLWHILAVGLPLDFAQPSRGETGPQISARANAAGAFIGIAHPAWYSISLEDALSLESAHAVEIYNETCLTLNDRAESWYVSDQLSIRGRRLFVYAADDAHFVGRPDDGRAWVQVRAERLTPEDLLAALKAGQFYSSQGPELHDVSINEDRIQLQCSPASTVIVSGRGARSSRLFGSNVTRADLSLKDFSSFCRVTVVDALGRRAWTNPIWL